LQYWLIMENTHRPLKSGQLAWKTLSLPVLATFFGAILLFFGYVADGGKRAALGTYILDKPAISQAYVIFGALTLATLGLQLAIVVILAIALRAMARRVVGRIPGLFQARLGGVWKRVASGWTIVVVAVATFWFGLWVVTALVKSADGMILKPGAEIGTAWMRISRDKNWLTAYEMLMAATITAFGILSWRILTKFATNTVAKAVYGAWAMLEIFNLASGFAVIYGAGFTFQDYPVVAFSNEEQYFGKADIPMLIDSDDKLYAFLVIRTGAMQDATPNPDKVILFIPRGEVKWLMVLRQEPLHAFAHYRDLLSPLPSGPGSKQTAPGGSSR